MVFSVRSKIRNFVSAASSLGRGDGNCPILTPPNARLYAHIDKMMEMVRISGETSKGAESKIHGAKRGWQSKSISTKIAFKMNNSNQK
jgi:hypothetical protein